LILKIGVIISEMNSSDNYLQEIKSNNQKMKKEIVYIIVRNMPEVSITFDYDCLYDRLKIPLDRHIRIKFDKPASNYPERDFQYWLNVNCELLKKNLKLSDLTTNSLSLADQLKISTLMERIELNDKIYKKYLEIFYGSRVVDNQTI